MIFINLCLYYFFYCIMSDYFCLNTNKLNLNLY